MAGPGFDFQTHSQRIRWATLAVMAAVVLLPNHPFDPSGVYIALAVGVANALTQGRMSVARAPSLPYVGFVVDAVVVFLLSLAAGGFESRLYLFYVVPVLLSALHFQRAGGFLVTSVVSVLFSLTSVLETGLHLVYDIGLPLIAAWGLAFIGALYGSQAGRERRSLDTLADMAEALAGGETLRRVVEATASKVTSLSGAQVAAVLINDGGSGRLVCQRPAVGITEQEVKAFQFTLLHADAGINVRARGEWSQKSGPEETRSVLEQFLHRFSISNAVVAPMVAQSQRLGLLIVGNKIDDSEFSRADINLIGAVANQAAVAISNAQLYIDLTHQKAHLEGILDHMGDPVIVIDGRSAVTILNPQAERCFGLTADAAIGRPLPDALAHASKRVHLPEILEAVESVLEMGKEYHAEVEVEDAEQQMTFQLTFAPLRDAENRLEGGVAAFADISKLKEIDRVKSDFVSIVSHELQTPLTSIKGYLETLLRRDVQFEPEKQRRFLDIIHSESDRLIALVTNLLDLSRIEAGATEYQFQPVDLQELAEERAAYARREQNQHPIRFDFQESLPAAWADRVMLGHVLDNLLANAIKYSPQGGPVTIAGEAANGSVSLSVHDRGLGISKTQIPHVFDKFQRTDSRQVRRLGGVGLGLFIARSIIEAHHGIIEVESQEGVGSVFRISIPLASRTRATTGGGG